MVGALSPCFIGRKISCIKNTERESQTVGKIAASWVSLNQESQNIIVIIFFFKSTFISCIYNKKFHKQRAISWKILPGLAYDHWPCCPHGEPLCTASPPAVVCWRTHSRYGWRICKRMLDESECEIPTPFMTVMGARVMMMMMGHQHVY